MSKIRIPSNINMSNNALDNIKKIENNENYNVYVPRIQEFLDFVSTTPMDIYSARQRGWRIEKLVTNKRKTVFSIRVSHSDRFTYEVEDGKVTVLGVLGHYKGTYFESKQESFDDKVNTSNLFFNDKISYQELLKLNEKAKVSPKLATLDDDKIESAKKRLEENNLVSEDVDLLEFIDESEDEHIYLDRKDLKELYGDNLNYVDISEIRKLASLHQDELEKIFTNKEDFSLLKSNKETVLNNATFYKELEYDYSSENPLIKTLLMSRDISTRNLGILLSKIEVEYPNVLSFILDEVKNNISYSGNEMIFTGNIIDRINLESTLVFVRKALSHEETKKIGIDFLINTINGNMDMDFEFYALNSYLKAFVDVRGQERLNDILVTLNNYYENGNKEEALDNMRKLITLVCVDNLRFQSTVGGSFYDPNTNTIYLDTICNSGIVVLHEFGHAMDAYYSRRNKNQKNNSLLENARTNFINNEKSVEFMNKLQARIETIMSTTSAMYDNGMISKYGSIENAYNRFGQYIVYMINSGNIERLFYQYGVPMNMRQKIINDLNNRTLNIYELSKQFYNFDKYNFSNRYFYTKKEGMALDIITSIFGSREIRLKNGEVIELRVGHTKEYYDSYPDSNICEIIANFNALIVSGNQELLDIIRELIGEELYNYIIKERNTDRIIKNEQNRKTKNK